MASTTPIVRQISWLVALPSLLVLTLALLVGYFVAGMTGFVVAAFGYVACSFLLRTLVPREHRQGIALVRKGRFTEAIAHFERGLDFFQRHQWLDDWRGLVLLSSSRASYREMALLNLAFCHSQAGDGVRARAAYEQCLQLFPDSAMAQAALRLIAAAAQSKDSSAISAVAENA